MKIDPVLSYLRWRMNEQLKKRLKERTLPTFVILTLAAAFEIMVFAIQAEDRTSARTVGTLLILAGVAIALFFVFRKPIKDWRRERRLRNRTSKSWLPPHCV